ncbi:MAG: hypothetical protein ABEI27_08035 [Halobellus sp.]|uniref:hypothetical protein n=1 Tax=Halobellus sp. TaxID=1979212 RepID=UPI0035D4CCC4
MAKTIPTLLMAGLLLVATVTFGASAFTAATVDRSANVDVVTDSNGLLALTDGNSGNLVFQEGSTGQLSIDFTSGTADGANVNATFELGDPTNPTTSNAFKIANRDDEQHQINVEYTGATTNGEDNLEFSIYDSDGNSVGSVTEEGTTASFTAPADDTFYVVVTVDTGGGAGTTDLTSTSDLSGELSFTIDDANEGGSNSDDANEGGSNSDDS